MKYTPKQRMKTFLEFSEEKNAILHLNKHRLANKKKINANDLLTLIKKAVTSHTNKLFTKI